MNLDMNDVQTGVLIRELHGIIQSDRYPLSPRIVALKEILGQLRPEPACGKLWRRNGIMRRQARVGVGKDVREGRAIGVKRRKGSLKEPTPPLLVVSRSPTSELAKTVG